MYNRNYGGKGLIEFKFLQKHSPKPKKRKLKPVTDGYTEPFWFIKNNKLTKINNHEIFSIFRTNYITTHYELCR